MADDAKIALIIPAFNEEERIDAVLSVATAAELIDEIVVVDDGSTDRTADRAEAHGIKVIRLPRNMGKGAAVQKGISAVDADIYLFSDADILGLKVDHFVALVEPLIRDPELQMTLGKFAGGRLRTDLSQSLVPTISGQRAMRRSLIDDLPDLSQSGFGVETLITRHAKARGVKAVEVTLNDLTHVMKEEKLGLVKGLSARLKMYQQIAKSITYSPSDAGDDDDLS